VASGHDESYHIDTARIEALSDGVFAIAITLLIIEIGVPHVEANEGLGSALRDLWPSYFGFALSFMTIGVMWANHHGMFKDIERADHTLIVLNLLLLLCISFVPFPTAVLAEYMKDSDHALAATLTYGLTFVITAIVFNAIWLYASVNRRLIDDHVSDARVRSRTRRYVGGAPFYAIGVALAFISTWLAIGLWSALALFFLLPLYEEPAG
jgi:uncharacterized membrane protein